MTFAKPPTHIGVKLSKLVKKARQLGCETFSGSVDGVVVRNWLKKVFDTLTNMELDDELKFRVATRLIDKSAATLWDNLKLRTPTPITWNLFVQEFNEQFYTQFHRDQKMQEFFLLRQFEKIVTQYESKLRAKFVPELANSEEYLCSKFEEGLSLKI